MRYTVPLPLTLSMVINLYGAILSMAAPPRQQSESARNFGLTTEEVQAVFGTGAINSLNRALSHSECHSNISHRIHLSCGGYNGAEASAMTEQDKKGLAISLTLCSIESALQTIPTECQAWSPHAELSEDGRPARQGWFRQQAPGEEPDQQAKCLGALHRSAQDWSSYNVYLSDATQLCHVLESRRQAELAQMRYMNATQEKLAFIDLLKRREEQQAERSHREAELLRQRLNNLKDMSETVFDSMRTVRSDIEINKRMSEDVQTAFSAFELARGTEWDRIEATIQAKLLHLTDRFQGISDDFQDSWIPKMSQRLETILTSHDMVLVERNEQTGRQLQDWLRRIEDQVNMFATSTSDDLYLARLGDGFQRLESMVGVSLNATAQLTVAQAEMAEIIQETARRAEILSGTQNGLETSMNRTIDALRSHRKHSLWSGIPSVSLMSGPALFPSISTESSQGVLIQVIVWTIQIVWQLTSSIVG
ncbi:hypothetical protein IAT40_004343 [Kwoniella sp. CBS 6097]